MNKDCLEELIRHADVQRASAHRSWMANHENKLGEIARLKCVEWAIAVKELDAMLQATEQKSEQSA